jgi:hypothetical protein
MKCELWRLALRGSMSKAAQRPLALKNILTVRVCQKTALPESFSVRTSVEGSQEIALVKLRKVGSFTQYMCDQSSPPLQ